jgi:RNA polymerase sigma-70 factor (ECF subfamily)
MTLETVSVNQSDQEMISLAQGGDHAAFERLVHRYDREVLSIAHTFTNDPDESKDIYQEVFLRVYRALPSFEFRSEFSTWLYRIVTNVCLTHKKRSKSRSFTSIDEEMDGLEARVQADGPLSNVTPLSPERLAESAEINMHIEAALETLSEQQRLVFTLKHYQGYKLREIADMMDCSEGTVKRYMFNAMDKMRKRLSRIY